MPSKEKRLYHQLIRDITYEMDQEILRDMNNLLAGIPDPEDILGVLLASIRDQLRVKLPASVGIAPDGPHKLTIDTIVLLATEDWLQAYHGEQTRRFDYNDPAMVTKLILWLLKRLRTTRTQYRKQRRARAKTRRRSHYR